MNEELQEFLRYPREELDVELKCWLNPYDRVDQAKIAKAIIALRNHGGGYLIIGFINSNPPTPDPQRPDSVAPFDNDFFNNTIKRYAEPSFHCSSHIVEHPTTSELFPIVVVPGGATTPVRCKSSSPDDGKSAKIDTYYVRRPGPESAPPQSGAEWDALITKCLLARKAGDLLSSKLRISFTSKSFTN